MRVCAAALLLALAGCGTGPATPGVAVTAAWSRATPPGASVGVLYFDVANHGPQPDRLLAVSSSAAARVEMHETTLAADGMMRMQPLSPVELPAGATLRFLPDGRHAMLIDLAAPLVEGALIEVSFTSEHAPPVRLQVPVRALGATSGSG
jgi:copper(I)-binding protein